MKAKQISLALILAVFLSYMAGKGTGEVDLVGFAVQSGFTVKLAWAYPDTCALNTVANFKVLWGMRSWKSATQRVTLDSSVLTNSKADTFALFVESDTTLTFGGLQYYFAVQALDAGNTIIARSDTLTLVIPFYADVAPVDSGRSVVDIFDLSYFTDFYKAAYGKTFNIVLPQKRKDKIILRFK